MAPASTPPNKLSDALEEAGDLSDSSTLVEHLDGDDAPKFSNDATFWARGERRARRRNILVTGGEALGLKAIVGLQWIPPPRGRKAEVTQGRSKTRGLHTMLTFLLLMLIVTTRVWLHRLAHRRPTAA